MFSFRMHKAGRPFLVIALVITIALAILWSPSLFVCLPITIWVVAFFRDPGRVVPQGQEWVVSPADGVIQSIKEAKIPKELALKKTQKKTPEKAVRIAVFMNVFDCHVNRSPIEGKIIARAYRKGAFLNAALDKASEKNERLGISIKHKDASVMHVVQIAGLIARRILSWTKVGDNLKQGERFGLIRFGSRVDVYLPANCQPMVGVGARVRAGETIIARFAKTTKSSKPSMESKLI